MKKTLYLIQKILLFPILISSFLAISHLGWGQSVGDYRSFNNGNWSTLNTWQRLNTLPNTWVTPTAIQGYPGQNASPTLITIRNGDAVDLNMTPVNSIGSIDIPGGNKASSLTILLANSLTVSGAISLTSTSNNKDKAISVNGGSLSAASISMSSGGNLQDTYIEISTGTVTITSDITMTGSSSRSYVRFTGSGTLNIGGTITGGGITSSSGGGTSAPTSGAVNYNKAGSQTVGNYNYYNLTLSGSGTKTFSGAITINSNLSISSGVIANLVTYSSTASTMSIGGEGVINGSWGSSSSSPSATYKNDSYFAATTGLITITTSTCTTPVITVMTATTCSASGFTATPVNVTNGTVPSGTTYSWPIPVVTGGLTGGASGASASSITGTLTNTTNTAQTATYTITPLSYGRCTGTTFTLTVTVSPKPAVTAMTSTICSAGSFTATPANVTNGIVPSGTTYSWSAPSVAGITGTAAGSAAANISGTLTNTTNAAINVIYTVTPTSGSCTGSTFTVTVTVSPKPGIANKTANTCSGTAFTVSPANGTDIVPTGTTYSWSAPSVAGITGTAAGSAAANISGTLTNITNAAINVIYTVTPISGSCTGSTFTVTVTVNPDGSWTGASDNDWNNPGNWACNQLPTLATNVTLGTGKPHYPTISSGAMGAANNLTIQSGAAVTVTGNTLQIGGTISNSGSFTASAGTIEMKGSAAQNIAANVFAGNTIMNLTVNNPTGVTLQGPLNVFGIVKATNGDLNSGGNLTLVSTAIQTALIDGTGAGNVLGNVTMQRYLPSAFGYKYFSSPFQAATVSEFSTEVNLSATFPGFYTYDENHSADSVGVTIYPSGWVPYNTPASSLVPLAGYAANFGVLLPAATVDMTGQVNNGNLQTTLYNHHRKFTQGFNLVGNPYPSPVDWNAPGWTKTNIDGGIHFFNASGGQYSGTYSSYVNGVSTENGDNVIAAMQGFFVHVSTGNPLIVTQGTLGINNSVRFNNLNPVFKRAIIDNRAILRFTANLESNKAIKDAAVIYFDPAASLDFDQELDALKMINTDLQVPNIYTLTPESTQLSINGMPLPTDSLSKIALGITTFTEGWITLQANEFSQLPNELHIYLMDAETGIQQDLKQLPEYRIYLKPGAYNRRFTLVFSYSELTEPIGAVGKLFTLSRSGDLLLVKANLGSNAIGSLLVTNLLGQKIMQKAVVGNETVEINPNVHTGVYVITLISGKQTQSEKIIMRKDYE